MKPFPNQQSLNAVFPFKGFENAQKKNKEPYLVSAFRMCCANLNNSRCELSKDC